MSGWMWRKQIEHFQDYHCLVPDLPEHGKSISEKPFTIRNSAERIIELIQAKANGRKAHLVGHSLGGKIIVDILSFNPAVVDHAVIGSALFRPIPYLNWMYNTWAYKLTVWMLKNDRITEWQTDQFKFPDPYYRENFIQDSRNHTVGSLDRIYKELYQHLKIPEGLTNINSMVEKPKVFIIAGAKEPAPMRQSVSDLVNAIPESKGALIHNARHNYPWVLDQLLNRLIRGWLRGEIVMDEAVNVLSD